MLACSLLRALQHPRHTQRRLIADARVTQPATPTWQSCSFSLLGPTASSCFLKTLSWRLSLSGSICVCCSLCLEPCPHGTSWLPPHCTGLHPNGTPSERPGLPVSLSPSMFHSALPCSWWETLEGPRVIVHPGFHDVLAAGFSDSETGA